LSDSNNYPRISLDEHWLEQARICGTKRYKNNTKNKRISSAGKVTGRFSTLELDIWGAKTELALCLFLGWDPAQVLDAVVFRPRLPDLRSPKGGTVEVKAPLDRGKRLALVAAAGRNLHHGRYVLLWPVEDHATPDDDAWQIRGWVARKDFEQKGEFVEWKRGAQFCLDNVFLKPWADWNPAEKARA